jgi:hypothetical protein
MGGHAKSLFYTTPTFPALKKDRRGTSVEKALEKALEKAQEVRSSCPAV